jgi:outer membrane murein-binding lipoprotein Lpp
MFPRYIYSKANIVSYPFSPRRIFMFTRTIALFSIGLAGVLFAASQTEAQPGRGSGKGPGAGADIQKLEKDLARLLEQVQETKDKIARAKEAGKGKGPRGFGFGGFGPKGFEGKGTGGKPDAATIKEKYELYKKLYEETQRDARKGKGGKGYEGKGKWGRSYEGKKKETAPATPASKWKGGWGTWSRSYEGKKKETAPPTPSSKRKGSAASSGGASSSVEARIDRLIRELEQIRNEVKAKKR